MDVVFISFLVGVILSAAILKTIELSASRKKLHQSIEDHLQTYIIGADIRQAIYMMKEFSKVWLSLPVPAAVVSQEGIIERCNDRCAKAVGIPKSEIEGRHFKDITHPEDVEKDVHLFGQLASGAIDYYKFRKQYLNLCENTTFEADLYVWRLDENNFFGLFIPT